MDRRNFIKNSAIIGAAAALPRFSYAQVKGNDRIKVALVGCGGRGTGAMCNMIAADNNIKLVAMGDLFEGRADASAKKIYEFAKKSVGENKALDIILMEKKLLCSKKGIALKCYADCSRLSYVTDVDFYSLFGNAIDNAIEAVKDFDEERRSISLNITRQGNIVSISIRNPYRGEIDYDGGLPLTHKGDRSKHGFGLKSVSMIAERYGGTLKIDDRNHTFSVCLLFLTKKDKTDAGVGNG